MAEQLPFDPAGWTRDAMGAWTRTLGGLLLRAWRDPDGSDEPWTWEVLRVTDVADYEIGLGGAETRGAALVRAEITAEEPPFDPAGVLLAAPDWWLEVRCGCGRVRHIPVGLLMRRYRPRARAPELVARMRCGACRCRPVSVEGIENPERGAHGSNYPPPWRGPVPGRPGERPRRILSRRERP
jgi:hypothetical protein